MHCSDIDISVDFALDYLHIWCFYFIVVFVVWVGHIKFFFWELDTSSVCVVRLYLDIVHYNSFHRWIFHITHSVS